MLTFEQRYWFTQAGPYYGICGWARLLGTQARKSCWSPCSLAKWNHWLSTVSELGSLVWCWYHQEPGLPRSLHWSLEPCPFLYFSLTPGSLVLLITLVFPVMWDRIGFPGSSPENWRSCMSASGSLFPTGKTIVPGEPSLCGSVLAWGRGDMVKVKLLLLSF